MQLFSYLLYFRIFIFFSFLFFFKWDGSLAIKRHRTTLINHYSMHSFNEHRLTHISNIYLKKCAKNKVIRYKLLLLYYELCYLEIALLSTNLNREIFYFTLFTLRLPTELYTTLRLFFGFPAIPNRQIKQPNLISNFLVIVRK